MAKKTGYYKLLYGVKVGTGRGVYYETPWSGDLRTRTGDIVLRLRANSYIRVDKRGNIDKKALNFHARPSDVRELTAAELMELAIGSVKAHKK